MTRKSLWVIIAILTLIVLCIVGIWVGKFALNFYDVNALRYPAPIVIPEVQGPAVITCATDVPVPVDCKPVIPTPEPDFDVVISGCPAGSLGINPNTNEPLIFKQDPYPGVLCEFEVYYATQIAKISFPDGQSPLVQDWAVSCPTGPLCEGTWVQTNTVYVPAGVLMHYWVYPNSYTVQARFPTFACEYLAYGNKGHTNANIRTPIWALGSGSTFDAPACVGFADKPGK